MSDRLVVVIINEQARFVPECLHPRVESKGVGESGVFIVVKDRDGLPAARRKYYASLSEFFLNQIGSGPTTILEAGSGRGQLTFPLIACFRRKVRLITVDSSKGPTRGPWNSSIQI